MFPNSSLAFWFKERTIDLLIAFSGIIAVLLATIYVHFLTPPSWEQHSKVVNIPGGTGFQEISRILEENGIVRDRRSFYLLGRLEEAVPRVKAGEYEFHTGMTPGAVLAKLVRGEVIKYPITIPEGFNIFQVGEVLEQAKVCGKKFFLEKTRDRAFIASLGLDAESLEGYLFPDTYNLPKGFGEEQVIHQMVSRFKTVYASLAARAEHLGLNRKEVVILASMIEKEAKDDQERRLISAVFHNRLHRGMALQSDPTAVYGVRRGKAASERITKQDLQRRTPHNTYHISGLPKGPIANPGLKSLKAALYPADVNYLYFVSKNDGTHYFSRTLEEHNRAVNRYQRKGKKNKKQEISPIKHGRSQFTLPNHSEFHENAKLSPA
ncbi:MAG: endolytic transglycosylase MltG [Deltaproteobacteria bacterium]|nr:endolytic transglycosylase MltG [Deltaproteobacteria bacterium]